jgi:UDP-3-O-[3-hydroxymyristoyl] glucosamine N-acyltransferase
MIKFDRINFFPLKNKFSSIEITKIIRDFVIMNDVKDNFDILDISSDEHQKSNSILFINKNFNSLIIDATPILVITDNEKLYNNLKINNKILIKNYNEVYHFLLNEIFIHEDSIEFSDDFFFKNGSYISKYSLIDDSVRIQKNCVIGRGVKIGKNVLIKHNTVIKNSIISDNSIICENTTIGSSGFGFDLERMGSIYLSPQLGIVYIDENVFIGTNCTIDRGKIDFTYIGKNSMIR